MDLHAIKDPTFLKNLSNQELNELAKEIRSFLIEKVSQNGGHLSSNLGVVELTIAMHKVFNSPTDKLIFDVGHQAYVHKILTGRATQFDTLRKMNGLSGYLKRDESVHDVWEAGHSSTAIAALTGFEEAKKVHQQNHKVVALVGDGSLNSGLSFEALNYIGHKPGLSPIIIINDNEMSISKNVGTLSKLLNSMRSSKPYVQATKTGKYFPKFFRDLKNRVGKMIRGFAKNMTIFDDFGLQYYGPIDGHDIKKLVRYLQLAKESNKPCVVHVITKKGKGYSFAENDTLGIWHGVAPFSIETGKPLKPLKENEHSWSTIISSYMFEYAKTHPDFRIIVPAMISGSGLTKFQEQYPNQIIDVGICESFAVCLSGSMALNQVDVFIPIYSSFLQRAYDQVSHDIARQDIHVVFGVDRSGLVGDDGETHQGLYDIAFLRHIPNMEIVQPSNPLEAYQLLDYAFHHTIHPIAIRYSRGKRIVDLNNLSNRETITKPSWTRLTTGDKLNLISYGDHIEKLKSWIETQNLPITLYNARFIKPMDETMLKEIAFSNRPTFVLEDVSKVSGLGSQIFEYLQEKEYSTSQLYILGLPDKFIEHGTVEELYQKYGLDTLSLHQRFQKYF